MLNGICNQPHVTFTNLLRLLNDKATVTTLSKDDSMPQLALKANEISNELVDILANKTELTEMQ